MKKNPTPDAAPAKRAARGEKKKTPAKTASLTKQTLKPVAKAAIKPRTIKSAAVRPVAVKTVPAKPHAAKTARKTSAARPVAAKTIAAKPPSAAVKPAKPVAARAEVKAKRTCVPVDLAAQYGEKVNAKAQTRVAVADMPKARRPRRNAAEKAKLQEILRPDDDILARLARANSIGATRKRATSRRSKTWKAKCGRCGTASDYAVPAALCARCGAILMRVED